MRKALVGLVLLAFITPVSALPEISLDLSEPTSTGQALIGFRDGYLPNLLSGSSYLGFEVKTVEARINYLVVYADDLAPLRAATQGIPGVAYVEDDALMTTMLTPNDSQYNSQYGPQQMGAPAAWSNIGYGSSNIVVAVLDTGIRSTHEDLAANYIGGYDYVNNDATPNDDCGHGTHVSGTVAAVTDNGIGVAGVSQASILHHKVLGPVGGLFSVTCSGSSSDINAAIMDAADNGVDIISMSLGGGGFSSAGDNAVNYAYTRDVLVVAASGNDGAANGVGYPAAYTNAIAVGALESNYNQASYSNGGDQMEISAGGSNVQSTYNSNDASYDSLSGTSMATPHVAGALALAKSCDPTISAPALRQLMHNTAQDLGPSGWDSDFGYGLIRVDSIINQMSCGGNGGNRAPTADASATSLDLTASFDGSGSNDPDGDALSYSWTFGDGVTSSSVSPSHTYANNGTYTATLTVSDGSLSDSDSISVVVSTSNTGSDPDPSTPNMDSGVSESVSLSSGQWAHFKIEVPANANSFDVAMTGPGCGLTGCAFDADMYVRADVRPTTTSYDCRPYQSGNAESCAMGNVEGWYYVSAYAYSGSGTITLTATHDGSTTPPVNQAPNAGFSSSSSDLTASFNAGASSDPDGDSLSYSWMFGDGNSGSGVAPSYTYSSAGTYTVSLTVSDGSLSDSASSSVTVTNPPVNGAPTASFSSSANYLDASFDGSGSSDPDGDTLSYSWTFGDGATASAVAPSHSYAAAGTYTVTLTVSDGSFSDSASSSITMVASSDPDPSTTTMNSGATYGVTVNSGAWVHGKIYVPAGGDLIVSMTGDSCGLLGCSYDIDLYVNGGSRATTSDYDCRPYQSGSDESCTMSNLSAGWYYVGAYGYSGSGNVDLTATVS